MTQKVSRSHLISLKKIFENNVNFCNIKSLLKKKGFDKIITVSVAYSGSDGPYYFLGLSKGQIYFIDIFADDEGAVSVDDLRSPADKNLGRTIKKDISGADFNNLDMCIDLQ
jgi:hypothetical protein